MATRSVKARVALEGEAEYKQAISEINAGNRTLASEMKKLQAEYKGNTDSVEFLTKKGELLERQLLQQRDKVETLRQAVQKSAEQFGESDKRTQEWITSLNNAEAAEFDLQHAIEENNAALQGEDNTMISLGDTVQNLADKLGIQLPDGAKKALDGMGSFSAGTAAKMAVAAAAVAAVIKVVKELGDLTLEVASQVDEYITQSAVTGVSTDMLQAWDYAAPLIDTDAETIKSAMVKITQAMGDARDGSEEAIQKFSALGVSITDDMTGALRSSEEVFYDIVDALGQMEDGTERNIASMELFGKNAQELNPIYNAGSKALKEYGEEAKNVGFILSKDQVAALGAVDDSYQKLQMTIQGVKNQIAADFAPAAQSAMETFSNAVQKAGEFLERSGLIQNLASIISSVFSILDAIGKMVSSMPGLGSALDALNLSLKAVAYTAALIADAFNVLAGLMPQNWGSGMARTALGWNMSKGELSNVQQLKYGSGEFTTSVYDENLGAWVGNGYNATGNDNWRGGLTWVGEGGPELVALPRGSQILNAQDSRNAGAVYIGSIVIDAQSVKEFNDIVEIVRNQEMYARMG